MKVLAIIPAYNESETIEKIIDEVSSEAPGCDLLVVNDGSTDDTPAILERRGVRHLNLRCNLGIGGAVQSGFLYALEHGYDCAIQIDADGQHDPAYIAPMLETMRRENADIVIGSRFASGSRPISPRMVGSGIIHCLILLLYHQNIADPTSSMRLYNRRMIERFATHINMDPEPDVIAHLINGGAKVREVQVTMRERTAGTSYLNFGGSVKYMLRVITSLLFIQKHRDRRL